MNQKMIKPGSNHEVSKGEFIILGVFYLSFILNFIHSSIPGPNPEQSPDLLFTHYLFLFLGGMKGCIRFVLNHFIFQVVVLGFHLTKLNVNDYEWI